MSVIQSGSRENVERKKKDDLFITTVRFVCHTVRCTHSKASGICIDYRWDHEKKKVELRRHLGINA